MKAKLHPAVLRLRRARKALGCAIAVIRNQAMTDEFQGFTRTAASLQRWCRELEEEGGLRKPQNAQISN